MARKTKKIIEKESPSKLQQFADYLDKLHIIRIFAAINSIAIILAVIAFGVDLYFRGVERERFEAERQEWQHARRIAAWQLLTTKASGAGGKRSALEYLYNQNEDLTGLDISCQTMGGMMEEGRGCERPTTLYSLKLTGLIDETDGTSEISVKLDFSNFNYTIFIGTDLSNAQLARAKFVGADLSGAKLIGALAKGADFSEATLEHSNFDRALLNRARFVDANITGASFRAARITNGRFNGAKIIDTNFGNAVLTGSNFDNADFSVTIYNRSTNFEGTDLSYSHFSNTDIALLDFSNARIDAINFSNATFCSGGDNEGACALGLTQESMNNTWAWEDRPPIDIELIDPPIHVGHLCNPILRERYESFQISGIPDGCKR